MQKGKATELGQAESLFVWYDEEVEVSGKEWVSWLLHTISGNISLFSEKDENIIINNRSGRGIGIIVLIGKQCVVLFFFPNMLTTWNLYILTNLNSSRVWVYGFPTKIKIPMPYPTLLNNERFVFSNGAFLGMTAFLEIQYMYWLSTCDPTRPNVFSLFGLINEQDTVY